MQLFAPRQHSEGRTPVRKMIRVGKIYVEWTEISVFSAH